MSISRRVGTDIKMLVKMLDIVNLKIPVAELQDYCESINPITTVLVARIG